MWNASNVPFNQINFSSVPNMSSALQGWQQTLTFNKVVKTMENYEPVETTIDIKFQGVWQPLSAEKLKMKPEAQWSWKWIQVHAMTSVDLINDDVIKYKGVQYRVKEKLDYMEYGFFEYHLMEDFVGAGPTVLPEEDNGTP